MWWGGIISLYESISIYESTPSLGCQRLVAFLCSWVYFFSIDAGSVSGIILSLISLGVLVPLVFFSWKFSTRAEERRERAEERREHQAHMDAKKKHKFLMQTCIEMINKLQNDGFSSLNQFEKKYLFKLSDQMGSNLENLHENEVKVLEVAFSIQGVYNMLQMRSNQLQPNNQAALSQLKGIKYASMVSGVNAAREMGESFSE